MTASRRQHDAKVPIKKPFIHKITAEAWHGYNQEIHTENTGAMSKQIVISNLICFKIPRYIHSVFRSCSTVIHSVILHAIPTTQFNICRSGLEGKIVVGSF